MKFNRTYNILIFAAFVVVLFYGLVDLHAKSPDDEPDEKETPSLKLKMLRPHPHAFTYSPVQDGTLYTVFCEKHPGDELGPILIWKLKEGGLVDIGSLSSFDEILRTQVLRMGNNPDKKSVLKIVAPAIGEYVQLQLKGRILYPNHIDSFLSQMKPHVSEAIYNRIKNRLVYSTGEVSSEGWIIPMFVFTVDSTIEFIRFSGSFEPFCVSKRETEVIAGAGDISKFCYVPPYPKEWEDKTGQPEVPAKGASKRGQQKGAIRDMLTKNHNFMKYHVLRSQHSHPRLPLHRDSSRFKKLQ